MTVLLFSLGILCFLVGLCTEMITLGQGIVGGVALGDWNIPFGCISADGFIPTKLVAELKNPHHQ
jgi:hypothetical protein